MNYPLNISKYPSIEIQRQVLRGNIGIVCCFQYQCFPVKYLVIWVSILKIKIKVFWYCKSNNK